MTDASTADVFLANTLGPFHTFLLSPVQLAPKSTTPTSATFLFTFYHLYLFSYGLGNHSRRAKGKCLRDQDVLPPKFPALPLTQVERDMTPIRASPEET